MKTIWKYTIEDHMLLPVGFEIVRCSLPNNDHELACIWAIVDPDASIAIHRAEIVLTGGEVPEGFTHIGTDFDGPLVLHFFLD